MTSYNTGIDGNHMSLEQARTLGFEVDTSEESRNRFQLPTGMVVEATGRVAARVQFAWSAAEPDVMTVFFNVFNSLSSPVLLGSAFLHATETLTTRSHRLIDLPAGLARCLKLRAIGNAVNKVSCIINGFRVVANPDTGSEIALMSGKYAAKYGLLNYYGCEELELADGSREYTSGYADVEVAVRIPGSSRKLKKTVRFHVLKHLQFDVILDEHMVEDFGVFKNGLNKISFVAHELASLSPIVWLGSTERKVAKAVEDVKTSMLSIFSVKHQTPASKPSKPGQWRKAPDTKINALTRSDRTSTSRD